MPECQVHVLSGMQACNENGLVLATSWYFRPMSAMYTFEIFAQMAIGG